MQLVWKAYIARRSFLAIVKAKKGASEGRIVLTDRYPQNQYAGINDGPCTQQAVCSFLDSWLVRYIQGAHKRIEQLPPDIVVKLLVPPEIGLQRKPDLSIDNIRKKAEVIAKVNFEGAKTLEVDATKPLAEVVCTMKRELWSLF